jgi:hypothetical protein
MGNGNGTASSSSSVLRTEMQDALAECKGHAALRALRPHISLPRDWVQSLAFGPPAPVGSPLTISEIP